MFKEIIITIFIAGCAVALPQAPLDNGQLRNNRIVGGRDALVREVPSMVSITRLGAHICGGVILNRDSILTAAHCTGEETPSIFSVRAGSIFAARGGQSRRVSRIILHPSYNGRTLFNDIAVLKLATLLTMSASVVAIVLPLQNQAINNGNMASISGWGGTNTRGDRSPSVLQTLEVPFVGNMQCAAIIGGPLRVDQICAGGVFGRDVCYGDEGGPLIITGVAPRVVGILSWGSDSRCAVGWPMVYTRVSAYLSFINGTMTQ